jgi:chromosome segregation ATPase
MARVTICELQEEIRSLQIKLEVSDNELTRVRRDAERYRESYTTECNNNFKLQEQVGGLEAELCDERAWSREIIKTLSEKLPEA